MSRHRNVRSLNYEDEYDGYDDVYGHSVEEADFCISPGTESQFLFDRSRQQNLSSYFGEEGVIQEEEEGDQSEGDGLQDSSSFSRPELSAEDEVRLNSCLEELRNILGDSTPEHVMIEAVIKQNYDFEKSLNTILNTSETPKQQRDQNARERNKDDDENVDKFPLEGAQVHGAGGVHNKGEGSSGIDKEKVPKGFQGFSLANLAAQQRQDDRPKGLSGNVLKERSSNVDAKESNISSPLCNMTISANKNDAKSAVGSERVVDAVSEVKKSTVSTIPVKPTSFSLADLAKEHSSSPPRNLTNMSSTPPRQQTVHNPPKPGISLAQLAQHQSGSPPVQGILQPQGNQNHSRDIGSGSSLSALAQKHSVSSGLKSAPAEGIQVVQSSRNPQRPTGFNLSALAVQHDERSNIEKNSLAKTAAITQKTILPPPGFKLKQTVDLSALAAKHKIPEPSQASKVEPTISASKPVHTAWAVLTTKPSIFGRALCSNYSTIQLKTNLVAPRKFTHPKFSFVRQISKQSKSPISDTHPIIPFDFSSPSPDDIVLRKQQGAFTRTGARSSSDTQGFTAGAAPTITLQKPAPPEQNSTVESSATAGVARMTFSSGSKSKSGFTPDKDQDKRPESEQQEVELVRRDLNVDSPQRGGGSKPNSRSGSRSASPAPKGEHLTSDGALASGSSTPTPGTPTIHKSASKAKMATYDDKQEYEKRKAGGKDFINLVVVGHVDAGKSTLMGHVLYQMGFVNKRTMHKYEQESKKLGKASFAYAWVLDETEEERTRGVTMDVAQTRFQTDTKVVTLLDAPGHKDFIPNMITGAAQADVAVLVINSTRGEFETGFDTGGQTREHAMLIRSLGVSQLCVAVNKMDTVEWDEDRFKEITAKLGTFLKQTGFKEKDICYVPCSGLSGENLTKSPTEPKLSSWYKGPSLVQQIDKFTPPDRPVEKPLRLCVTDVFKGMGAGLSVPGTIQAGSIHPGDKVNVMPQGEIATVKSVLIDDVPSQFGFAGDNATVVLTNIDATNIGIGSILCDIAQPIPSTSRIRARIVIFNIEIPITKGFPVVFHYQSLSEPAHVRKLVCQLHKSTGEVVRKKPRCLTKNSSAVIELDVDRPICIELYKDFKDLGRFMLRSAGATIAAGLVTDILDAKSLKE